MRSGKRSQNRSKEGRANGGLRRDVWLESSLKTKKEDKFLELCILFWRGFHLVANYCDLYPLRFVSFLASIDRAAASKLGARYARSC